MYNCYLLHFQCKLSGHLLFCLLLLLSLFVKMLIPITILVACRVPGRITIAHKMPGRISLAHTMQSVEFQLHMHCRIDFQLHIQFSHLIYPSTARVVGAPQMISQPISSTFSLFSTALWDLANSRPVHSLMLSSHLFLCLPCLHPPFTVPCKMVLARPDELETWPYYLRLLTYNSSCTYNAKVWICFMLFIVHRNVTYTLFPKQHAHIYTNALLSLHEIICLSAS